MTLLKVKRILNLIKSIIKILLNFSKNESKFEYLNAIKRRIILTNSMMRMMISINKKNAKISLKNLN